MGQIFKPKLPPSDDPFPVLFHRNDLVLLLKDSFKLHTILSFGAVFQLIICAVLPFRWAIVPPIALLLNALVTTILQINQRPNDSFSQHIVQGRASARLPSRVTGEHRHEHSKQPLVVFHLGMQPNHPLGAFGPGGRDISVLFQRMSDELHEKKEDYGFICMSGWTSRDRLTNNGTMLAMYFHDVEGLNKFAHGPAHRAGWDYFFKSASAKHMGIYHETFLVQPGGSETLYINAYPTLLGGGRIQAKTSEGPKYISTLVNADIPALKTQWARLGRDAHGNLKE